MQALTRDAYESRIGTEIGLSRWFAVGQGRIDAFAEATGDRQFIHTDPGRAALTPFGGTIAHGFLSLSLISAMAQDCVPGIVGEGMVVNYGLDRLRFLSPVPAGSRLRGRFALAGLTRRDDGAVDMALDVTVEIDGAARPALVARWLLRRFPGPG